MRNTTTYRLSDIITDSLPIIGRLDQKIYLVLNHKLESLLNEFGFEVEKADADIPQKDNDSVKVKVTAVSIREFNQLIPKINLAYLK